MIIFSIMSRSAVGATQCPITVPCQISIFELFVGRKATGAWSWTFTSI